MSLFARRERRGADSLADILAKERGGPTWAGPVVNEDTAMRLAAVWSCTTLIADLVSTLPIDQYRHVGDRREQMDLAPVIANPSALVDPIAWRRQAITSWLLRGNLYGVATVVRPDGWPVQVEIAHPDWVSAYQPRRMAPVEWTLNGKPLHPAMLYHSPAFTIPGSILGLSPIAYMRQTVGVGLAAQEYGARWFGEGAHPSAILKTDKPVDEEQAKAIKQRFVDAVRGRREPAVLGLGLDYQRIQIAPNESQFLDTIKANRADIAAIFFPHLILSEDASMTYANVESRTLDLLVFDLQPWLVRFEHWLSRMLPRGQFVKVNADALVRTTLKERYEAHAIGIKGGFLSPDEAREKEDRPPIPNGAGNVFLWPPAGGSSKGNDEERTT